MPVEVQGPDGQTYHFPDGTDKAAAIKYFKKKGIGLSSASGAPPSRQDFAKTMKTGEGPIATNLTSFEAQLSKLPKATAQLLIAKHWPIVDSKNYKELWEDIKSLNPVMRQFEGGPVDYGATAANLLPAIVGGVKELRDVPVKEIARKGLSAVAGTGPERTTEPLVEEFKTKSTEAKTRQAEENQKTQEANRGHEQAYHEKLSRTFDEAKQEQIEGEQHHKAVEERNHAAQETQGTRSTLAKNINEGSKAFGEGVKELARKVKSEQIDPQYNKIREATANDPGIPLAQIAKDAREAESLIKGSSENVKQFRELLRKTPETEGVMTSAGFTVPGEPLYDQLVSEGAIDTGGNLPYSDLQGYSEELGAKLRKGGLPSDVYRAIKHLQTKIDAAKLVVAERNGVGSALTKANSDFTHYQDTFFEKPSAVAATLDRVGKLDPEHYAEPIISGKSAQLGIMRLQHYAPEFPEAGQLVSQAKSLRKMQTDFDALPRRVKTEDVPETGIPKKESPTLKVETPKQIEQPKTPTLDDVRARKTKEVKAAAREIGRLSRYDATLIAGSAIGPFFGRWETLLIDPAYLMARKGLGQVLDRPAVLKWLSEPSPEDIRILNTLPPEAKADIAAKMTDFAVKQKNQVPLAPSVKQFLGPVNTSIIATASAKKTKTANTADNLMRSVQGREPGRQKKDLQDIQQKYSNPNLPVGP
jgi:hypothetical protein